MVDVLSQRSALAVTVAASIFTLLIEVSSGLRPPPMVDVLMRSGLSEGSRRPHHHHHHFHHRTRLNMESERKTIGDYMVR